LKWIYFYECYNFTNEKVSRPAKVKQNDTKLTDHVECCFIRYKCDKYHSNYNLNKLFDTVPLGKLVVWQESVLEAM
jgi:hypothetical protein